MPVYNFAAGPAMLPQPVIKQIKEDLPSFDNSGMSVMEISHRSNYFEKIIDQAQENLRKLMGIPDDYEILFLQGGATTQFAAIPLNIAFNKNVGLVDTGHWAIRAMEETKRAGINVETIASSKDDHYRYIPQVPENIGQYDYIHITANNTIEGTAYHQIPDFHNPIVADVSSNFFS
jgi:Phosphoserine aminotransferase